MRTSRTGVAPKGAAQKRWQDAVQKSGQDAAKQDAHTDAATVAAWGAVLLWSCAVLGFGAALDGFSHAVHPVALLGARGVPNAWAFDVLGFVLPGLLAAWASWRAGRRMERAQADRGGAAAGGVVSSVGGVSGVSGLVGGVGTTLCAIAGIAFAAQGVFPLDANAAHIGDAVGRMHAAAWTVWWIAFAAGAVAGASGWVVRAPMRMATLLAAAVVLAFALFVALPGAPAMAQRIATLTWLAWVVLASHVAGRSERVLLRAR